MDVGPGGRLGHYFAGHWTQPNELWVGVVVVEPAAIVGVALAGVGGSGNELHLPVIIRERDIDQTGIQRFVLCTTQTRAKTGLRYLVRNP